MSRNGSGVYSKPAGTTAVSGTTIESAKFNELMDDFATDLNTPRPVVAGGTGGATPAAARAAIGVDIGVNVQGYDAGLASIAGLTVAADQGVYATGADTFATYALGSLSRTLLANTTTAGYRSTLELGTAATRAAEDTLTDGANLPDGAAITAYVVGYAQPAYEATGAFPASGAVTAVSHGLGAKPARVQVTAEATAANNGFAIGDELTLSVDDSNARGKTVFFNSTQIGFSRLGLAYFISKDGTAQPTFEPSQWRLRFRAWL